MNYKNSKYRAKKNTETILVMSVLAIMSMIIIVIAMALLEGDDKTYYIEPIVPFETETENEAVAENNGQDVADESGINQGVSDTQEADQSIADGQGTNQNNTDTQGTAQNATDIQGTNQNAKDSQTEISTQTPVAPEEVGENLYYWNEHYYAIYSDSATWEDAAAFCEEKGGYMAAITSREENDAIHGLLKEKGITDAYFGWYLDKEVNEWKWIRGEESFSFTNWGKGEPNGERGKEKYGMFYSGYKNGEWNDGDFGEGTAGRSKNFICEWNSYPENY